MLYKVKDIKWNIDYFYWRYSHSSKYLSMKIKYIDKHYDFISLVFFVITFFHVTKRFIFRYYNASSFGDINRISWREIIHMLLNLFLDRLIRHVLHKLWFQTVSRYKFNECSMHREKLHVFSTFSSWSM